MGADVPSDPKRWVSLPSLWHFPSNLEEVGKPLSLRKWVSRYKELGLEGLSDQSRRPKSSQPKKVREQQKQWILELRQTRKLGARRLQNELKRLYGLSLSTATIHKVLTTAGVKPLKKIRRAMKEKRRYQKDIPGDRVLSRCV